MNTTKMINELNDLDHISIDDLVKMEPNQLKGKMIEEIDRALNFQVNIFRFEIDYHTNNKLYIAGSFNNWKPNELELTPTSNENKYWFIDFDAKQTNLYNKVQYKLLLGSNWMRDGDRVFDFPEVIENITKVDIDSNGDRSYQNDKDQKYIHSQNNKTLRIVMYNAYF